MKALLKDIQNTNTDHYFTIVDERQDYKGDRTFKFNHTRDKVVQVTLTTGDEGAKGRNANVGITLISKQSFLSNYLPYGYVRFVDREYYAQKVNDTLKILLA